MRPHNTSRGVSVVEALVAVSLLGLAGTSLAASFSVVARADTAARVALAAADAARERVALLSARSCGASDTGASMLAGAARTTWRANRVPEGWAWFDTTTIPARAHRVVLAGTVRCRA